jgi:hypothetical protein
MEEKQITFETAKLAKKKGFDLIQRFSSIALLRDKTGKSSHYSNYGFMYSGLSEGYISAPTQTFLQNWLREKHGIHIEIYANASGWGYILTKTNGTIIKEIEDSVFFDSPEEALEVGLVLTLKQIKKS